MKFRDVIQKLSVHNIISETLQMSEQPYYYDCKAKSSQYQVHIFYKDQYKEIYDIKKEHQVDFFVNTVVKLSYNCEYEFQSFEEISKLLERITGCLWNRYSYKQTVKSTYNVIKTFTGLDLSAK